MRKAKGVWQSVTVLLFILALSNIYCFPAQADTLKWSSLNIPSGGSAGNWVLADAPVKRCLTCAADGALFCYANPTGTPFRLFKSVDGGYSWSYTGGVTDIIVDMAVLPDNPNIIFYTTASGVYKSLNAGNSFTVVASNPGGAGSGNKTITSLDAISINGSCSLVVSVADADALEFGGVYIWDEIQPSGWKDSGLRNLDVCTVVFSPHYSADRQMIALATDEYNTVVTSNIAEAGWGLSVGDARIMGLAPSSGAIAFPSDYSSNVSLGKYFQFIGLKTGSGSGDIYSLTGQAAPAASILTDLNAGQSNGLGNVAIASLAVSGNAATAMVVAGASASAQVYFSNNGGSTWRASGKPPTGRSATCVVMSPDFASSGCIYALTGGTESAFSISRDNALTWNQTALINTRIITMLDLAVSPVFDQDKVLFLLTGDVEVSLWFSSNGGTRWERCFSSTLSQGARTDKVLLSPQYYLNHKVYLAWTNHPFIWRSEDNGQNFTRFNSIDPVTGDPVNIDAWAITSADKLFIGTFDGNHGIIYQTGSNGLSYVNKAITGNQTLNSLAFSPDYDHDRTILAGNTFGSIFYSSDNGSTFERLPQGSLQAPLFGDITVACDFDFIHNKTVYGASGDINKGLYRYRIDSSTAWEPVDGSLPAGAKLGQIAISPYGPLYVVNLQVVDNTLHKGGIERILNPLGEPLPASETITSGLNNGCVLKKLCLQGNGLWSLDAANSQLMSFTDTLIFPVNLTAPADNAANLVSHNTTLEWSALEGAAMYHWQIDTDNQFADIPHGLEGDADVTSVRLTGLDSDSTYYWRVRVIAPVASPWSAIMSFNTNSVPVIAAPRLSSPRFNGTSSVCPAFRWTSSAGADKYELQVSEDNSFLNPVIDKSGNNAFATDAWVCDVSLKYSTNYYWRVRAAAGELRSNWSDVSIFTTAAESSQGGGISSTGSSPTPSVKPSPSPEPTSSPSPALELTPEASPGVAFAGAFSGPTVTPSSTPVSEMTGLNAFNQLNLNAANASANPPGAADTQVVSPTPSPSPESGASTLKLVFFLVGGLIILTMILVVVVIFMLKKFKNY